MVANILWYPVANFLRGCHYPWPYETNLPEVCHQPLAHIQEGCPNNIQRGNLCVHTSEESKIRSLKPRSNRYFLKLSEAHLQIMLYRSMAPTAHLSLVRQSIYKPTHTNIFFSQKDYKRGCIPNLRDFFSLIVPGIVFIFPFLIVLFLLFFATFISPFSILNEQSSSIASFANILQ